MLWFGRGHIPSWIYVLYDWEAVALTNPHLRVSDTLEFLARRKASAKRQKAADKIRHHIHKAGAAESADEFIVELLQDGPAQMTLTQAREYVANMRRRD